MCDLEVKAYSVAVIAFGVVLTVQTMTGELCALTMTRIVGERLADSPVLAFRAIPAGSVVGK